MGHVKNFNDFIKETKIDESSSKISDEVYAAMNNFEGFNQLGMDQQAELIKIIVDKIFQIFINFFPIF